MSTVKITRVEDIQPGDRVTLVWNRDNDTTVSGVVRTVDGCCRCLEVADRLFWLSRDLDPLAWHVAVATREVPDAPPLPTEPGSVIVNATIRGVEGQTAILDTSGFWFTQGIVDGFWYHNPEHITAWEPGRIVPDDGAFAEALRKDERVDIDAFARAHAFFHARAIPEGQS